MKIGTWKFHVFISTGRQYLLLTAFAVNIFCIIYYYEKGESLGVLICEKKCFVLTLQWFWYPVQELLSSFQVNDLTPCNIKIFVWESRGVITFCYGNTFVKIINKLCHLKIRMQYPCRIECLFDTTPVSLSLHLKRYFIFLGALTHAPPLPHPPPFLLLFPE